MAVRHRRTAGAAALRPASLPALVHFSGATSGWTLPGDWIVACCQLVGVFLLAEAVVGGLNHLFPVALTTGRFPWEGYGRSSPQREDRLRDLLRSSCALGLGAMNLVLAGCLALCVAAAQAGADDLGPAVQIACWVGGIIVATLLAHDVLVRYRPPEEA